MATADPLSSSVLRLGGVAAVGAGLLFFAGVQTLVAAGWYPEGSYAVGEMAAWLAGVRAARALAVSGLLLSLAGVSLWMVVALVLYLRVRGAAPATALAGLAGFLAGVPAAFAAFGLGAGATWALTDASVPADPTLASVALRGFSAMDYAGSVLVGGLGVGALSAAALRAQALPRWVAVVGVVAAVLVTLAAGSPFVPALGAAAVGYPLLLLWFVLVGIALLRAGRVEADRAAPSDTHA